jgi:hypothetical protein
MLHGAVHTSVFSHWIFCSGPVTAVHLRFPPAASSTALHSSATVCVTEPLTQILSYLPYGVDFLAVATRFSALRRVATDAQVLQVMDR